MEENTALNESFGHVSTPRYVDPHFEEKLNRLDCDLEARWNPIKCRWEIFRSGKYIMTVQTDDGNYAHLDNRVLYRLVMCDTWSYASKLQFIESLHLEDAKFNSMKVAEQDEFMRACYRDLAPILRGRKSVVANYMKVKAQEKQADAS